MARHKKRITQAPWKSLPKSWELKRIDYIQDLTIHFLEALYAPITRHCTIEGNKIALQNQAIYPGAQNYFMYKGNMYGNPPHASSTCWHDKLHASLYDKVEALNELIKVHHESIEAILAKAYIGNSLTYAQHTTDLDVLLPSFFATYIKEISVLKYTHHQANPLTKPELQYFMQKNQDGLDAIKQQLAYNLIYSE